MAVVDRAVRWVLVVLLAAGAASACGDAVTSAAGTGGGATSSATSGGGGAGTGTGGSAQGGGPAACGGEAGTPCGPDEFCDFDPTASCGGSDDTGLCAPRPEACTADCPGVCGCDGAFYCNACAANAAGFDVDENASCAPPDAVYTAWNLFTHVPRFVVFKADFARDLCFRLWIEPAGPGDLGIQVTAPWGVNHAEVTDHASDCNLDMGFPPPPVGSAAPAVSGTGTMDVQGSFPCDVTIHATVSFDAQAPWVPMTEPFDADAIPVDGGCG